MARANYNRDKQEYNKDKKEYGRDKKEYGKDKKEYSKDRKNNKQSKFKPGKRDDERQEQPKKEGFKPKEFRRRENRYAAPVLEENRVIDDNILYGRNAVIEALKAGRDIDKLVIQKGEKEGSIIKIIADAKDKGIVVMEAERSKLDDIVLGEKHQGVIAYAAAQSYVEIEDILAEAESKGEQPFILILENIQDPHNLGAIMRSAHNAGVHGIIIPKRRAVGLSGTVAKSSAGAIEYMKVAKVTNIAQTIKDLKQQGIWVACADMGGKVMYEENLTGPIAIVVGSEGEGISKLVRENCDYVVSVPMYGKVTSLNASVAASVLVYEIVRQRHFK